jgi:5-methylcytosine-specific restriction endonuclease McrA
LTVRHQQQTANGFYLTKAWRRVRLLALQRDDYSCVVCGANVRAPGAARVDHIRPLASNPELGLVLNNLRTLCVTHDNQARERGRSVRVEKFGGCDANGVPINAAHHWHQRE